MMVIDNKFELGETVYLKTDTEQCPRMVITIAVRPSNALAYSLSCGTDSSIHYDFEMTREPDNTMKVIN